VNAACQGNLSAYHRFANPGLCFSLNVTVDGPSFTYIWTISHNNCSTHFPARSQTCEKRLVPSRLSVHRHATTRLPPVGFSWNFIFEDFSKIFLENSSFIKIGHEYKRVLYMKTNIRVWSFLLRMRNVPDKSSRESQNTFCVQLTFFFFKSWLLSRKCGKVLQSWAGHRWQYGTCTWRAGYLRLQTHTQVM
jgi:hypothetical protein